MTWLQVAHARKFDQREVLHLPAPPASLEDFFKLAALAFRPTLLSLVVVLKTMPQHPKLLKPFEVSSSHCFLLITCCLLAKRLKGPFIWVPFFHIALQLPTLLNFVVLCSRLLFGFNLICGFNGKCLVNQRG